jgi:hypothetical protein
MTQLGLGIGDEPRGRGHDLPALAASPLVLTVVAQLHHCNDCGCELHPGDPMVWAQNLGVPFCVGCAAARHLFARARPSRSWRLRSRS